jgi:phenylalanyl-tRNA synthetase beta chain
MKLPLKTTKKYTELPDTLEDTVELLANRVGEVESYKILKDKYDKILVAQVKEKKEHTDADKLAIYMINIGTKEDIQVIAGDKTLQVGDKVAYIQPGGIVPSTYENEPFEIKSVKMRGEMSNGMMCSEKELDIGPDHKSVLRLPEDAPVGESFATYYELDDTVVEIENKALTNRGDLFGILGLSRELAGAQGIRFESPKWYKMPQIELEPEDLCLSLDVDNQAEALCPRYCAIAMTDINVEESPIWLKSILLKSGIKPVNVIVDITNYLMIVTGQPLHAFDFDKVVHTDTEQADMAHIVIRTAKPEETIHTLDDKVYELTDRNLVIANSAHPIAIAGAIGGVDTEIDKKTKNIILESANFDRYNLRKTSMELGIVTEASTRFTRSQSPALCDSIISKAVELIEQLTGGKVASTLIDSYPTPQDPKHISIDTQKLRERLGVDITNKEVIDILKNIEYEDVEVEDNHITAKIPIFRQDIDIQEDVYEDIIRIYGYNKIKPELPKKNISATTQTKMSKLKSEIRDILSNSGANELISYSFTNIDLLNMVNQDVDSCFKIKNPLSKDLQLMRPSILQSLLEKAKVNTQQGIGTYAIYEMGISHQKDVLDQERLPLEEWKLSFLFTEADNDVEGNPYFQSKRYLQKILQKIDIRNVEYTLLSDVDYESLPKWIKVLSGSFEPNSSAVVTVKTGKTKIELGIVGEIGLEVKDNLSLNPFTCGFEINLESLLLLEPEPFRHTQESKYPYITQDICFVVPDKVTYQELLNKIKNVLSDKVLRSDIKCLDIYKKDDSDTRNITLRISISSTEKTLKDKDFKKIREKIEKSIKNLNISMLQ